jgi:hypothetical protein
VPGSSLKMRLIQSMLFRLFLCTVPVEAEMLIILLGVCLYSLSIEVNNLLLPCHSSAFTSLIEVSGLSDVNFISEMRRGDRKVAVMWIIFCETASCIGLSIPFRWLEVST